MARKRVGVDSGSGLVAHPVDAIEQHPRAAHALLGLDSPEPNLPVVLLRSILIDELLGSKGSAQKRD